jgi:hypothetical protein
MEHGILNIFPEGSLASSVTTTVFIGVIVSVFFNLRFGWVLSGLVVPGYLVPLLIVKPWAAFVIFIESIVTYSLVWGLSEYISGPLKLTNLFGRDRFFAFLIFSMLVRILFDVFLLPYIGEFLNNKFYLNFDYRNNLHSFGLIIVALMANQYWKSGLFKGVIPQLITIGVTYLIVKYPLMEHTNFSISNISYIYEDIATSILASPKSYIILITTSLIASRMNLQYGWEYSGILIPSLLALLWYHPQKIAATMVESLIILQFARLTLKMPIFKGITIEKGRKILLFFTISFIYKYIISYLIIYLMPGEKISDYYGFGYLLPTLIAIKMHDKDITIKVTRSVVQTSFVAMIIASIIGYSLTFLNLQFFQTGIPIKEERKEIIRREDKNIFDMVREEKVRIYHSVRMTALTPPIPKEIEIFKGAIKGLMDYIKTKDNTYLQRSQGLFSQIGYSIHLLKEGYLYIRQDEENLGWGTYIFNPYQDSGLVIEVPLPIDEWGSLEAGARLFKSLNGYAMAIGGISIKTPQGKTHNPLIRYDSIFQEFHKLVEHQNVLQLRGYNIETVRWVSGERPEIKGVEIKEPESLLLVRSRLPYGLNLSTLRSLIGSMTVEWGKTPFANIQRDSITSGFAELFLNRKDIKELLFKPVYALYDVPVTIREQRIDGYLQDWLLRSKWLIAEKGSNLYRKTTLEELLFMDEEVLTPLIRVSQTEYSGAKWTEKGLGELRVIASASALFGYKIILYRDRISGEDFIILVEDEALKDRRYWGTYVLRLGESNNYIIHIPRPLFELNVFEYGVSLFARLKAKALLIGGTHPYANHDLSSDLINMDNKENLFNLVNQALLREFKEEAFMSLQCRALGLRPERKLPQEDVLLTFDSGITERDYLSPLGERLINILDEDGLKTGFVDGREETSGYETSFTPSLFYVDQTLNKEFAILWLSPFARTTYRQQTENRWQNAQFEAVGIPTIEADLYNYIMDSKIIGDSSILPSSLLQEIKRYAETQDIIELYNIKSTWRPFRFRRIIDINTKQSFLFVYSSSGRLILVANLVPREPEIEITLGRKTLQRREISRFIDTKVGFLRFRGEFEVS